MQTIIHLNAVISAVTKHGLPSRVRSKKEGKNVAVAQYLLEHPERGMEEEV